MLFKNSEYKERLKKVKDSMQKQGIDLLVSHDPANMNYLTGYDAWSFYYAQCVLVHLNEDEPICFLRAQDAGGGYIKTYVQHKNIIAYDEKYIHTWPLHPYQYLVEIIKKNIEVMSFSTFNLDLDVDFARIDPKYLSGVLTKLNINDADALFVSCTALPALEILEEVEKKINKPVFSSNQTLIWDTIRSVGYKSSVEGYGKLLKN